MSADEISRSLTTFIRERFLDEDSKEELEETTPLLEWGVLNSMNIALLLSYIRDELGTSVPAGKINQGNFQSIRSLTDMVVALSDGGGQAPGTAGAGGTG